jgi:anti-sigma B factor antagonist
MSDYQQIRLTDVDGVTVVRFIHAKILDDMVIQQLGEELISLVTDEQRESLLLNFEGVQFLSSAALGKLIKLDKTIKSAGGKLKLACIRPEIYEVFTITKLDQQFDIKSDEAEALAAF